MASCKPRLLLAACCGPCATVAIERLTPDYDVTVLFYGDNLNTKEEYDRRLGALRVVYSNVIVKPYEHKCFDSCEQCFRGRLLHAAEVAGDYDVFATSLTTSPHKDAKLINKIGAEVSTKYLATDFKKNGGFNRSVELSKALGIYRQNYCGCGINR